MAVISKNDRIKLGVVDTGIGGLITAGWTRHLLETDPAFHQIRGYVDIHFIADAKNFPYGQHLPTENLRNIDAVISHLFHQEKCDRVAIACNTASILLSQFLSLLGGRRTTQRLDDFRNGEAGYDLRKVLPIAESTSDGFGQILQRDNTEPVLVNYVGTQATVGSGYYAAEIQKIVGNEIAGVSGADLAALIEIHGPQGREVKAKVENICDDIKKQAGGIAPQYLFLLCTHYELVRNSFAANLPGTIIVTQGEAFARSFLNAVITGSDMREKLARLRRNGVAPADEDSLTCEVSGSEAHAASFQRKIATCFSDMGQTGPYKYLSGIQVNRTAAAVEQRLFLPDTDESLFELSGDAEDPDMRITPENVGRHIAALSGRRPYRPLLPAGISRLLGGLIHG